MSGGSKVEIDLDGLIRSLLVLAFAFGWTLAAKHIRRW
jgi:hypothetical protein